MPDDRAEAMKVTNPSLTAIQATRKVSFVRGAMDRIELARLLDAFAAQAVQRERERLDRMIIHVERVLNYGPVNPVVANVLQSAINEAREP